MSTATIGRRGFKVAYVAPPAPDHVKAAEASYAALPLEGWPKDLHGYRPVTVRNLLHAMACTLTTLDYKRRHQPDMPIHEAVAPWLVSYAGQAKALLWATKDAPCLTADMPAPAPLVVSADDCRSRFLALFNDGELAAAINPIRADRFSPERREELANLAMALFEDLRHAGVVVAGGAA